MMYYYCNYHAMSSMNFYSKALALQKIKDIKKSLERKPKNTRNILR